jgi:glutamine synthetase
MSERADVLSDMVVGPTGEVWDQCPRGFLRRQVANLSDEGLTLNAAFENEFFLLRRNDSGILEPTDDTVFCATGVMNRQAAFVNDLADALDFQFIPVESYHPESGPGQQEMTFHHCEATVAADRQILYRETVRGVAARHGLIASFLPKVVEDKAGSGCHLNLSLTEDGKNITGDPNGTFGFGTEAAAFLAGILDHLPALTAITVPSKNSFRRIRPHFWAGAFRAWGYDNREGAVRALRDPAGSRASRLELKVVDATANPYLALGAVIAAGLDGIRRELPLTDEVTVDPGLLPELERKERGIDLLPQSLGEAIQALKEDEVLLAALGEPLSRSFIAVRETEWEALKDLDLEEEVAILAERY